MKLQCPTCDKEIDGVGDEVLCETCGIAYLISYEEHWDGEREIRTHELRRKTNEK